MNLLWMLLAAPFNERLATIRRVQEIPRSIFFSPKTTVALVNGLAAGAGADLALCCDRIVFTPQSRFSLFYSRLGLIPDHGALFLLARTLGARRALTLALDAEVILGEEAVRLGIADAVLPRDDPALQRLLERWSRVPSSCVTAAKQALWATSGRAFEEALEMVAALETRLLDGEEQRSLIARTAQMQVLMQARQTRRTEEDASRVRLPHRREQ